MLSWYAVLSKKLQLFDVAPDPDSDLNIIPGPAISSGSLRIRGHSTYLIVYRSAAYGNNLSLLSFATNIEEHTSGTPSLLLYK